MRFHLPYEPTRPPGSGVVLTVELPPKKAGCNSGIVTVSGPAAAVAGEQGAVAEALGRVFDRARLALGLAGEGKSMGPKYFVVHTSSVAGDAAKERPAPARYYKVTAVPVEEVMEPITGEEAEERGIRGRVFNLSPISAEDAALLYKDSTDARLLDPTPIAGDDKHYAIGVAASATPVVVEEHARPLGIAHSLARFYSNTKSLARPAALDGKAGEEGMDLIASEERRPRRLLGPRCSTTRAAQDRKSREERLARMGALAEGRCPHLLGLLPSGMRRLAVATMGAVASNGSRAPPLGRRWFHNNPVTTVSGKSELAERVSSLEVRTDALELGSEFLDSRATGLKSETTALILQAAEVETRLKSLRRGLTVVQVAVGSTGLFVTMGSTAVWFFWDAVQIRAFFVDQAIQGLNEYGAEMWENSKQALTLSNVSDVINRWTGGILGSSFEEQALKRQRQLAEWNQWEKFLTTRRPGEAFVFSAAIYKLRQIEFQAEQRRRHKQSIEGGEASK